MPTDAAIDPEKYLGLVWREAIRVAQHRSARGFRGPDHKAENFVGDGYLGLLKACAQFDPSRGFKLSTFATPRIRGAILDALRTQSKSRAKFQPEYTELSLTLVSQEPLPLDRAEIESVRQAVRDIVDSPDLLNRQERLAVVRRYWHEERQCEIARRMRVSECRVSQVLGSAHGKLFGALLPVVLAAPAHLLRTIQAKREAKADRQPRRFKQKRCAWCAKAFDPSGPRALYCSTVCRTRQAA